MHRFSLAHVGMRKDAINMKALEREIFFIEYSSILSKKKAILGLKSIRPFQLFSLFRPISSCENNWNGLIALSGENFYAKVHVEEAGMTAYLFKLNPI